ncbi:branched-chain amino acid aminotransferase [Histoplasma capsulatum var. duboisii H88]|uniref:Branched-chain-amino-acid aminotransferase n=1 Tax=Ajellomyces capsulatus (strain H88) TaxID=544711 RepID=F0U4P3_AJEC8|nr:branched-chain amino acid aminotransferase [Histoplasma capsulatum var. duboisii H88]
MDYLELTSPSYQLRKIPPPANSLPQKNSFSGRHSLANHMLMVKWNTKDGWLSPSIVPFQNLSLNPATCVFHYAFECFEGMKAYKDKDGGIRLFRPDMNMARLNRSSKRIALPTLDEDAAIKLISELVKLDSRFIPQTRGYSLYLRPTMIGTQETLGVSAPSSALLFVIASPVGPYYPTGFKAISLEATDYAVRAWPGGVGDKKLGANYAPCIVPQTEAAKKGHQQNLWLFGEEEYVTEVGTMNLFVALKNKETGQNELITAPLDGTILEGVTRDSVLTLARERLGPRGWTISERKLTMSEIAQAADEGRMIEVFGAGTAAIVSPVRTISWKGRTVDCGLKENEEAGKVALEMKNWIEGIQYGDEKHSWSFISPVFGRTTCFRSWRSPLVDLGYHRLELISCCVSNILAIQQRDESPAGNEGG